MIVLVMIQLINLTVLIFTLTVYLFLLLLLLPLLYLYRARRWGCWASGPTVSRHRYYTTTLLLYCVRYCYYSTALHTLLIYYTTVLYCTSHTTTIFMMSLNLTLFMLKYSCMCADRELLGLWATPSKWYAVSFYCIYCIVLISNQLLLLLQLCIVYRRFNVAITRGMALCVVVGQPRLLYSDPRWREMLKYTVANGGFYSGHCDCPCGFNCLYAYFPWFLRGFYKTRSMCV